MNGSTTLERHALSRRSNRPSVGVSHFAFLGNSTAGKFIFKHAPAQIITAPAHLITAPPKLISAPAQLPATGVVVYTALFRSKVCFLTYRYLCAPFLCLPLPFSTSFPPFFDGSPTFALISPRNLMVLFRSIKRPKRISRMKRNILHQRKGIR